MSRKPAPFAWRGVTTQLLALVVLPLSVLAVVIAFGGLSLHRQAMRMMVGERDERAARAAAMAISEQLNHRTKAIQGLALLVREVEAPNTALALLTDAGYLHEDFEYGLALARRGAGLLAQHGGEGFWASLDFEAPVLQQAMNRDLPPAFVVLAHPLTGDPVVLALATAAKGGPIALGAFDPAALARNVLAGIFVSDAGGAVYLVAPDGQTLYRSGLSADFETGEAHPGIREALAGNSGTNYVTVPGGEHVVSYSPVVPTGWALVIEEPWEAVTPPLLRTTEYAPFVLIPAFLLALVALWFGLRQIVQPLQALERQAAEVGRGNYTAIEEPVGGIAEIQQLQGELMELARRVSAAQAGLRGFIGAITTGQEEERRRLSRELHDDTLQALIALNQRIQLARLSIGDGPAAASLGEVEKLTGQTIENLRRLTRALRPIYLEDLGLSAALEALAREAEDQAGIPVRFRRTGEPRRLSPAAELALFRIAQEALNNTARHAQAVEAAVEIEFGPEQVVLGVRDDGRGFRPPESPGAMAPQGHFGLLGIHERCELIGARLEIRSGEGGGTRITVVLPAPAVPAQG